MGWNFYLFFSFYETSVLVVLAGESIQQDVLRMRQVKSDFGNFWYFPDSKCTVLKNLKTVFGYHPEFSEKSKALLVLFSTIGCGSGIASVQKSSGVSAA